MVRFFRIAAVAAAVMISIAGCSNGSSALGIHNASVRINGAVIEHRPRVRCEQVEWLWKIETLQDRPGFSAQVHTGDVVEARAVQIRDLGGFTGDFWDVTVGSADAIVENGTFVITGTAEGSYGHAPTERSTATFEIRTDC
jgi:hypothetical protein